jgi:hypothetical protein
MPMEEVLFFGSVWNQDRRGEAMPRPVFTVDGMQSAVPNSAAFAATT